MFLNLRKELLSIYGVGPETADSIILYAAEKPSFVVDTYTYRLFNRLGWVEGNFHYERLRALFMDNLPHDVNLFNEYHALIVRHGARVCQKTPDCEIMLVFKVNVISFKDNSWLNSSLTFIPSTFLIIAQKHICDIIPSS